MQPTYREGLLPSERSALLELCIATGFFHPHEITITAEVIDEALEKGEEVSAYFSIVALVDSRPVGFVTYGPIPLTVGSFDIYWIATHPEFQRKGIGRHLLSMTEQRVLEKGGGRIFIETSGRPLYSSTCAFYESCGYSREASIRDFYAPGDSKVIFSKAL